nr:astacin [Leptinotarsa decemlineata]
MRLWCLLLACLECRARFILPHVPDMLHPPVPNIVSNATNTDEEFLDPELSPGLFQGDMALTNEFYNYWRVGIKFDVFPDKMWKNGVVPYTISPLYEPSEEVTIIKAIRYLNFMTCLRFVPWDGKSKDYLLIWPIKYPKGCWSFVGRFGGAQIVSLQAPDARGPNCLGTEGRAIHELMHAIGIFHEQSRWDRDKFVKIHMENIVPQYKSNFDKQSLKNTTYSFEYDYDSIMHYGKFFFTKKKGKPTITPKQPGVKSIGQRKGMSKGDCLKVNDLYGCFKNPRTRRKYYSICNFLGI